MSTCHRIDELRDYAFDELAAESRPSLEQHVAGCSDCAAELDRLRLTTAALQMLPDREIPQRIAFVSDKIFEPSPARRWLAGFWNSGARLGFASACVLAAAIVVSAYHRPVPAAAVAPANVQTAMADSSLSNHDLSKQIDAAVAKAMIQVREEDAQTLKTALAESERKHDQERRALMVAMGENLDFMQKRLNTMTMMASNDVGVRAVKALLLIALATLCFAGTEPAVSRKSIQAVEDSLNDAFRANTPDPYNLLGTARGTYIPGYGTLFTVEMQLLYVTPPNPFRPVISPQEIESLHERKLKKLPVLREAMQSQMLSASKTMDGLPLNEHVAMEAILFSFSFENPKGVPQRIFMTAEKGKLLDAQANHEDLSTVIQEQDR